MKPQHPQSLALTLGLALLAGCQVAPTISTPSARTGAGVTRAPSAAPVAPVDAVAPSPFVAPALTASVTPASPATTEAEAKAVAANDEKLIESLSAALEAEEADAAPAYAIASLSDAPLPPVRPVLEARQARPPVRRPSWEPAQRTRLEERRQRSNEARQSFEQAHPAYAEAAAAMRQAVDRQAWRPNEDDDSTLRRTGSRTERAANGAQRRVTVTRVIARARPHFLVQSTISVEETGDGVTKTIRWERTLQADGACHMVFHHEYTGRDGRLWVTDWEKLLTVDGALSGTGSFRQCDRQGRRIKEDRLVIGGNDRYGQRVTCLPAPSPTPSASPVASPSAQPSATSTPEPTATPTDTPTPEPTAAPICRSGSVTGGGRLAGSTFAFGFGPEVVTINDLSEGGVELKADVADVFYDGATATLTGRLRAPAAGTVTLVVTDNGEGASDPDDTVTFLTGATVTASGPLSRGEPGGGNVQVRRDCP